MFKKILSLLLLILFLIPTLVRADGGMIPPQDYYVYETEQKAAIVYQNQTETLVLQTSFSGNAKDFAYIVPTPSKPEVSKVSNDIFSNLAELTPGETIVIPMMDNLGFAPTAEKSAVEVVEEKQVGLYEIKVLTATDADALYNWLKENNFTYPSSKKYILDDYIQNKWFFTTAKISTEAISEDVETKLRTGQLMPLKLVFQTDKIIYPLKISSVVEDDSNTDWAKSLPEGVTDIVIPWNRDVIITLYIFTDHKKEISGFDTNYANWIKEKEIEKLAKDDNGDPWVDINNKFYLTKLQRYLTYSEMTNDLFPNNAKDNNKVGVPSFWKRGVTWLSGIGPILVVLFSLALFFLLCFWQFTAQSARTQRICWILQISSFIFVAVPLLWIYFYQLVDVFRAYDPYNIMSGLFILLILGVFFLGLPILMIVLMLLEKYVQKKRVKHITD